MINNEEYVLELKNVVKKYQNHTAVDDISFKVPKGKIFGLLGPNGAGKTTLIRMITTILKEDSGKILLNGKVLQDDTPQKIGYMPEERGLYKKMKVGEHLLYLAQLKGMSKSEAQQEIQRWMTKFEITEWWNKKIEELSKGMQQKIQFIATVIHHPTLVILDEPFSGLDPINSNLIKDEIKNLNNNGVSIIFSTHRMEQVEEMCEHIVLINKGKIILDGEVSALKNSFKENIYEITYDGDFQPHSLADKYDILPSTAEDTINFKLKDDQKPNELLQYFINQNVSVRSYREILPSFNDIFIKQVNQSNVN